MCIHKMLVTGTAACMVICASTDCDAVKLINSQSPLITLRAVVPSNIEVKVNWWDGAETGIDLLGEDGALVSEDKRSVRFTVSRAVRSKLVVHGDFLPIDPSTYREASFCAFYFNSKYSDGEELNGKAYSTKTSVIAPDDEVKILFSMSNVSGTLPGTYVTSVTLELVAIDEDEDEEDEEKSLSSMSLSSMSLMSSSALSSLMGLLSSSVSPSSSQDDNKSVASNVSHTDEPPSEQSK